MRLPAERTRWEWVLRAIALMGMAWLVVGAFREVAPTGGLVLSGEPSVSSLHRWVMNPPADTLGLSLTRAPDRMQRDYLRALRRNGTAIAWEGGGLAPVMVDAEPLQDPAGGAIARITGPAGTLLTLRDSLGILDSTQVTGPGSTIRIPATSGFIAAQSASTRASVALGPEELARSVVVLAMAGWESKFLIRALEERGWTVDARLALAPGIATTQGRPFPLDPTRHAAVIALDSSAGSYPRELLGYVRAGGGVILGEGASPGLPALAAAIGSAPAAVAMDRRKAGKEMLGYRGLSRLRHEAISLESRDRNVRLAAWRLASGRVVQSGYRDTWRWRMEGNDDGVQDHRAWWAGLVATVARRGEGVTEGGDPAPVSSLRISLGPAGTLPLQRAASPLWPIPLIVVVLAVFSEWLSRRMRGAG